MNPEQFRNAFTEGIFSGLYEVFKLLFLTPPTCYIVFGMILLAVAFKIIKIVIKKKK